MSVLFIDTSAIPAEQAVRRINALDWERASKELDEQGSAMLPGILSPVECRAVAALYPDDHLYRSLVVMGRHGFGRGEYKYFKYPLPGVIQGLRAGALFPACSSRQPMERLHGRRCALSREAC